MALQENEMGIIQGPNKMDLMFALFDNQFRTVMFGLDTEPRLNIWVTIRGAEKVAPPWEWRIKGRIARFDGDPRNNTEDIKPKLEFSILYRTSTRRGVFTFED
jgi:hypothetical protein